ncbi:hypothetical protein MLD38_007624 [Melastoma candidum]|uniref:Uncharacterized protein n=1 Tax=Melastoma candidum TaxID=119954 RepID=A0ACB9RT21_9MYRT|nr:hypothetical protein MLD38_007624 [Melastoma candidum]
MKQMKVETVSTTRIRPASPTPFHLRILHLSLLDQLLPPSLYGAILLFYTSPPSSMKTVDEKLGVLFKSLAETLVLFYPLAGKLRPDGVSIDCDDEGAFVVVSHTDSRLEGLLSRPDPTLLERFVPARDQETMKSAKDTVLLLQFTTFGCGGIAISICPSHKLMDASSICTFVRTWSTITTRDSHEHFSQLVKLPKFIGSSLLPPNKTLPTMKSSSASLSGPISGFAGVTRRFIFTASKVAELKDRCSIFPEIGEKRPTRVEAVQALILKCTIRAASTQSKSRHTSVVFQSVNLRKRMDPPLPDNAVGNLSWTQPVSLGDGLNIELCEVVIKIRKVLDDFYDGRAARFVGEEGAAVIAECLREKHEMLSVGGNFYGVTSLCRFPFYEMDFGWGKPAWFVGPSVFNNFFVLTDTKSGDGVEAWMTLDAKEMDILTRDAEFLAYATADPVDGLNLYRCRL